MHEVSPERVILLGAPLDLCSIDECCERLFSRISSGEITHHASLNAAKYVLIWQNEALQGAFSRAESVAADGESVVWAAKMLSVANPTRVAGIDLFERLIARCEQDGWRPFLFGASTDVLADATAHLRSRFPQLDIAGTLDGYSLMSDEEVAASIRQSQADLLFVALPSPRKEMWIDSNLDGTGVRLAMGIGGTLDVLAGRVRRAPVRLQRLGLEWMYRWAQEPVRLFGRYARGNAAFMAGVMLARLRHEPTIKPLWRKAETD